MANSSGSDVRLHDNDKVEEGPVRKMETQIQRGPGIRDWIVTNMSWSWFTCTQSTGGIASLLYACPKKFDGIETIGKIVFIFNIVLFLTFTTLMAIRWIADPLKIKASLLKGPECYFFGSFWLTCATIIISKMPPVSPDRPRYVLTS